MNSTTVSYWCKLRVCRFTALFSKAPFGTCNGWFVSLRHTYTQEAEFCLCRSVGFKPSKRLKLKCSSSELRSKPVFNLCILLSDPSKTKWKHVDFESFQPSALSNQTPPNVQTREWAGKWLACLWENGFTFLNNQFLCIWGGIKQFKVVYCHFKLRGKF